MGVKDLLGISQADKFGADWMDVLSRGLPRWEENSCANAADIRDIDSTPGSGRSPGGGHGNPLQYSCLENPVDRGAWRAIIHGVAKSGTRLKWLSTHSHTSRGQSTSSQSGTKACRAVHCGWSCCDVVLQSSQSEMRQEGKTGVRFYRAWAALLRILGVFLKKAVSAMRGIKEVK